MSQSQEEVIKSLKIEKDEMLAQKEDKGKDVERLKKEVDKVNFFASFNFICLCPYFASI